MARHGLSGDLNLSLTLNELEAQVASAPPTSTLTYSASDLQAALGVKYVPPTPPPPPSIPAGQARVTIAVNVRATPAGAIVGGFAAGTIVQTLNDVQPVQKALDGTLYTWEHVQGVPIGSKALLTGYVASAFLVAVPPPSKLGLHSLLDGRSKVQAFITAGAKLASITIVGDAGYANLMAQSVSTVIYRPWPDVSPTIPDDDPSAEVYGSAFIDQMFARLDATGDLDLQSDIYIQPTNEPAFKSGSNGFWLGCLKNLTERGRKCAMGAYSVGAPEPADWQTMVPALEYAKANNHIVCLHAYCKDGTPAGQLSDQADQQYFELRFPRLFAAVPVSAQPSLVISEFAGQFKTGQFQGTDALLKVAAAYQAAIAPYQYVLAFNLWTAGAESGEWQASSIDSALADPRIVQLFV